MHHGDMQETPLDPPGEVRVGDVWVDNDPRGPERTLMVVQLCEDQKCVNGKSRRDGVHAHVVSDKGTRSTIRIDRFKSTRRDGYTLRHRLGEPSASDGAQA